MTVVPSPTVEAMWKSSIMRLTPGRPSPRVPLELKWSRMASSMFAMPGPRSRTTTFSPRRSPSVTIDIVASPDPAYLRMFRPNSDTTVANLLASCSANPSTRASRFASITARVISGSVEIAIRLTGVCMRYP